VGRGPTQAREANERGGGQQDSSREHHLKTGKKKKKGGRRRGTRLRIRKGHGTEGRKGVRCCNEKGGGPRWTFYLKRGKGGEFRGRGEKKPYSCVQDECIGVEKSVRIRGDWRITRIKGKKSGSKKYNRMKRGRVL